MGSQLYQQLWRACAGPLVDVPRTGDLVFYFPQGHIKQVEASMNLVIQGHQMRVYDDLPSKLLCRVLNVDLRAETTDTDEVYAQIVLMPEPEQNEAATEKPSSTSGASPRPTAVRSFRKTLTLTDAATHGGLRVPRRQANECLPPLDMSQSPPIQELLAKDLHGKEWRFDHIFRGRQRRHLLQGGWNEFVSKKKLVPGDTVIFVREENGELRVGGVRRATRPGPLSSQSMHHRMHAMHATVLHALNTKSMFAVYYKPRFTGTIVGQENLDPLWPESSWRYLKVRWDEPSTIPLPDRVSPWNIEPAPPPPVITLPHSSRVKRPRQNAPPPSPESSVAIKEGATKVDANSAASWRPPQPRLVAYATSSSSSGSISSTYTSGSSHQQGGSSSDEGGSPLSVTLSMRLVEEIANKLEHVQFPWLELEEKKEKTRVHIKSLVQEFCTTSNSALVLERWFSDLGVSWVLSINEDGSANFPRRLQHFARSWIAALAVIQVFIFTYMDGSRNQGDGTLSPPASEFARFLQSTFRKMLNFVDAIVAPNAIAPATIEHIGEATEPAEQKLQPLMGVHDALSATSEQIQLWPHCPTFLGSGGIIDEVSKLLSAKLGKLDEVVWDTVDEIRASLTDTDSHRADPTDSEAQQRSPDIHLVTRSITHCIKVLSTNYGLAHQIVSKAASLGKYVPEVGKISSLLNTDDAFAILIMEMLSCLQEKLSQVSQSFSDQSLQFLFLLNNTYFVRQQLHPSSSLESHMPVLTCKINEHIQSYLQASWAPVMSCLHDPTPLCLGRYSPLAKFKLEFQKASTAQMLWKVPDPELKRTLRKAIVEKVSSGFTKYLEDNNIITPKVTPQELEETLQQLFEG